MSTNVKDNKKLKSKRSQKESTFHQFCNKLATWGLLFYLILIIVEKTPIVLKGLWVIAIIYKDNNLLQG